MATTTKMLWRNGAGVWLYLALSAVLIGFAFMVPVQDMVHRWNISEEYGYGYLIPVITLFLIWQRKNQLAEIEFRASVWGLLLVLLGGMLFFLGEIATTHALSQYGFVVTIMGVALALMGWDAFRIIMVPLALLFFMVPFPSFIYNTLSSELQLISSQLGVAVIRWFGISVYLEGNVIDLGTYKLQVVEACSGLRYLFPLASLAFVAAYIYKGAFWKKAIIFLTSVPLTVFMNSFRIGVIGVLVEYGGPGQAEGFLHDFEGWVVFMACIVVLVIVMALLAKIGPEKMSLADAFAIDLPDSLPGDAYGSARKPALVSWLAPLLILGVAASSIYVKGRVNDIPERRVFAEFPLKLAGWKGATETLDDNILGSLNAEDYIMSNYLNSSGESVNFYVAYYGDQAAGSAAHSPRACIPGGGWLIKELSERQVGSVVVNGQPLNVNRLLIKKGEYTQVVYYWFQQRGRNITNEWLVKWFLFWDAMTRNRTDGALVRLTAFVMPGQDLADADNRLVEFAEEVVPLMDKYVPD